MLKFVARSRFQQGGKSLQSFGPTLASMRQWTRDMFSSSSIPAGSTIDIYEVREVITESIVKVDPKPEEPENA